MEQIFKLIDQNICFNIFIVLVILIVIKYISPNPDSVLFVLKKYLNFLIFKVNSFIKKIFNCKEDFGIVTFKGLSEFQDKAPSFVTYHQNMFIQKMIEKNPNLDVKILKKLYNFIEKMVSIDTDDYFLTVSDSDQKTFSDNELNKIKTIIFNKLNSGNFKFTDMIIQEPVTYYNNISGKEVNPFSFTILCDNNIGKLKIFISIDIRNDVVKNGSYIVIKKLRLNVNDTVEKTIALDYTSELPPQSSELTPQTYELIPHNQELVYPSFNPIYQNSELLQSTNYNNIEIPSYDEILEIKEKNNVNVSVPMVDFSKQFKTSIDFSSLEASNSNDTMNNMLDNVLNFKIPEEKVSNSTVSLISPDPMPRPNNLS